MADRYSEETLRLAGMLKTLAKSKRRSIRSIEQQMGVSTSIFHKVLKGDVTFHIRHLLIILDALEIDWAEFFHMAYPRASASPAASHDSLLGDLDRVLGEREPAAEEVTDAELVAQVGDAEFEERVKQVLHHLGLLLDEDDERELRERKKTA
jgi:transcriptional regulator with XRE-family HTH domain